MIYVALRFDDPSANSNDQLERGIIDALVAQRCAATFAVIPFKRMGGELVGLSRERADHLRKAADAGTVGIALHGFSHERRGKAPGGKPSEFAGLAAPEQRELIAQGLLHLKEVFECDIRGFVPPWNSYDAVTLQALETLGIGYLSGAWETPPAYRGAVNILPLTCNLATLELAVTEARKVRSLDPVVVAVMHHHDFAEDRQGKAITDLPAFYKLLGRLSAQPDLTVMPLKEIAERLTARDCSRGIRRYRLRAALPWRWKAFVPQYSLVTAPIWRLLWSKPQTAYRLTTVEHRE